MPAQCASSLKYGNYLVVFDYRNYVRCTQFLHRNLLDISRTELVGSMEKLFRAENPWLSCENRRFKQLDIESFNKVLSGFDLQLAFTQRRVK